MQRPKWWDTPSARSRMALPASVLYGLGATLHRWFAMPKRASVPVISIGNIVAGGAGKTPSVMAITALLKAANFTPHILSRGYGANVAKPMRVMPNVHSAAEVGDEALLLARAAPTWVFQKRTESAAQAVREGADVLVCDDALQHHALRKDINLLVIEGPYGFGNGHLLPAGPLRESLRSALRRVHGVIFIGEDVHLITPRIPISMPVFHADINVVGDTSFLYEKPLIAFAGIARPEKFFASINALHASTPRRYSFADHHPYSEGELKALLREAQAMDARLITTEKDWVRLPVWMRPHCHSLPIELRFRHPEKVTEFLLQKLPHEAP